MDMAVVNVQNDTLISINTSLICDETCTLISTNGITEQTTDFEMWLQKNGVESFVTNDNLCPLSNIATSLEVDEYFDKVVSEDNYRDAAGHLQCGILCDEDNNVNSRKEIKRPAILRSNATKTDKNMNVKGFMTVSSGYKQDVLENRVAATVELDSSQDICTFLVKDQEDCLIFVPQTVQLSANHPLLTLKAQRVTSFNLIPVAEEVKECLIQLVTNSSSKLILCPLMDCSEAFCNISQARIHSLKHMGIKPYKCDMPNCPWEFYNQYQLSRHKLTHSKSKNFICDFKNCNRCFSTIYNLKLHKKKHEKPATLACPVKTCDKAFQTENQRRVHCKTHNVDEMPFRCSVSPCNKSFFTFSSLQKHFKSHLRKESELCCQYPGCRRAYDTPYRLKEHMRSHTGQRPYVCNFEDCTWKFTSASKLRRHQSTHTKDRKFHCTIGDCTKSFLRPEHLKDHTLTHIGQRPFECEVCGSTFIGKSSLYMHVKKAHPDRKKESKSKTNYNINTNSNSNDKQNSDILLEQAIQSLGVPSDMMLDTGILPEELLENDNFSTVNLRDLE